MQLRDAAAADAGTLAHVFFRAVREGALGPYSAAQCAAWVSACPTADQWANRIDGLDTIVAAQDGQIVGFMAWNTANGVLDLAFVLPEVRGQRCGDWAFQTHCMRS